jgi:flavin-dependent dehydrogenase
VGYGELLAGRRPTRSELLSTLETLLPGATDGGTSWWGHHLPLAGWSWRPRRGPVLLAGDAAGLINPMTGEGIYYAVATGLLAGRAIADAMRAGTTDAGTTYRRRTARWLSRHLRDTALVAQLSRSDRILDGGIRAAAADQRVFDDLVELGLADGGLTGRLLRTILR